VPPKKNIHRQRERKREREREKQALVKSQISEGSALGRD
jgi:hypothetical protein